MRHSFVDRPNEFNEYQAICTKCELVAYSQGLQKYFELQNHCNGVPYSTLINTQTLNATGLKDFDWPMPANEEDLMDIIDKARDLGYRGPEAVQKLQPFNHGQRIMKALALVEAYGRRVMLHYNKEADVFDNAAEGKQYLIDQMVRALTGDEYAGWRGGWELAPDDENHQPWDEGVEP